MCSPARRLLSKAAFLDYLTSSRAQVYVFPYDVVLCTCGDANYHGWRLVPRESLKPLQSFKRDEVATPCH